MNFKKEVEERIQSYENNIPLRDAAQQFMVESTIPKYSYNFSWLGRPIIQYPQDIIAMQELIWKVKPDLIIETGIAHGGSLVFNASMLAQLDLCEAIDSGVTFNPLISKRKVLGIDIDIREHNLVEIDAHPMRSRIEMLEGSSIDPNIIGKVKNFAKNYKKIMILLDSNHTHEHVLAELEAYAPMVTAGSYCVVFDTMVEDLPEEVCPSNRPWKPGNNPKTAVWEYLKSHKEFTIDKEIQNKLLITVAPDGYLKKT